MKQIGIKSNQALNIYLSSFEYKESIAIRKRIIKACYIDAKTLYNWCQGYARIPLLYQITIEKTIKKKIFN